MKKRAGNIATTMGLMSILGLMLPMIAAFLVMNTAGTVDTQENVKMAVFRSDVSSYQDELLLKIIAEMALEKEIIPYDEYAININANTKDEIAKWIPSIIGTEYENKFIIKNGQLVYTGNDEDEISVLKEMNIKILNE